MTKIAYLHNLPLEYYPPATNFLDLFGLSEQAVVRVFTTRNLKDRTPYKNEAIDIQRSRPPNPSSVPLWRMLKALWWHVRTSWALLVFRPDAVICVEPHSAIAAWIYFRLFRGPARLFIHHHEYYEQQDYWRPGMRIPRLGSRLERGYLFGRASWISQTNADRLRLAMNDQPKVPPAVWHTLPNYPPADWARPAKNIVSTPNSKRLRLIYIGSASFEDTYIREVVEWVASHPASLDLHVYGYNVATAVWAWLEDERFSNVSCDAGGYAYDDLPAMLADFDVGLVLYKGNTTNFIYNVPNKVFEYLLCGLEIWYPKEMIGLQNFHSQNPVRLLKLDFAELHDLELPTIQSSGLALFDNVEFTAERAFAPMFTALGINNSGIPR